MTAEQFGYFLRGNVEIPLFKERLSIVHEISRVMLERYSGKVSNLLAASRYDAVVLLELICQSFPSFQDYSPYKGSVVTFHKRAQVFIGDVDYLLRMQKGDGLKQSEMLTAFPDYRLPQILRHLGILEYSSELAHRVDCEEEILHHSEMEVEIRAATICAVETLRTTLLERGVHVTTTLLSSYLWLLSKTQSADMKPHHLTRTTAY